MKVTTTLISILCCTALLLSCTNESEIPQLKKSKEDIWYWGCFKGKINGNEISLENEDNEGPIQSGPRGYYFSSDWDVIPDSINIMHTLINYNDSSELRITLYDLTPGERYLTLSEYMYWNASCISAIIYDNPSKKGIKAYYVPSEENPFRVKITDVIWIQHREPIIEVTLDGVLYNKGNKEDVMVIKGVYGTR